MYLNTVWMVVALNSTLLLAPPLLLSGAVNLKYSFVCILETKEKKVTITGLGSIKTGIRIISVT